LNLLSFRDQRGRSVIDGIGEVKGWLVALTDFGDLAVLLPLAAAMLIWLLFYFSRAASSWIIAVGFCAGLTALLKIVLYGCPPAGDIHSPSGHTSLSILVYGALALATATGRPGLRRMLVIGAGVGLTLAIAVSRLLLDAHSVPEVGLGLIIGAVSLVLFSRQYLEYRHRKVWPLLVAAGVLVSILHGRELHAEQYLHRITGYLHVRCG
jgi:membrane-associated phospholipid phosphatase